MLCYEGISRLTGIRCPEASQTGDAQLGARSFVSRSDTGRERTSRKVEAVYDPATNSRKSCTLATINLQSQANLPVFQIVLSFNKRQSDCWVLSITATVTLSPRGCFGRTTFW